MLQRRDVRRFEKRPRPRSRSPIHISIHLQSSRLHTLVGFLLMEHGEQTTRYGRRGCEMIRRPIFHDLFVARAQIQQSCGCNQAKATKQTHRQEIWNLETGDWRLETGDWSRC